MAFDGFTVSALAWELGGALTGGRITKIYQPESDALLLTVTRDRQTYKLLLSASASLPLVYLTKSSMANPASAPGFCMLLRKHLSGGRIVSVTQPEMERILSFEVEHLDEMGDLCRKMLVIELMGKHSNIIFMQPDGTIIDSIKRISANVSSVREVLPGRTWFIPKTMDKKDPRSITRDEFEGYVLTRPYDIRKSIYMALTGFSPVMAGEVCERAGVDGDRSTDTLTGLQRACLYQAFCEIMEAEARHDFTPVIYEHNGEPAEYGVMPLAFYDGLEHRTFSSVSELLEDYYARKDRISRIRQKSSDLRRVVTTALERTRKKYQLQLKQMDDTKKREKYRLYGELLTTYGYSAEDGAASLTCLNYYDNQEITIPLDKSISALDNAKKYFDRYAKLKRTDEALAEQLLTTKEDLDHLESVSASLDLAVSEADLAQIREELTACGYVRRHSEGKDGKGAGGKGKGGRGAGKGQGKSGRMTMTGAGAPLHYRTPEGYDLYVGKNNYQNEYVTFTLGEGSDWWFHAKGIPGSHVILKARGEDLPDSVYESAAGLAAYYSRGRSAGKVEIDYIQRKHVKKVAGARPGFVIYHTNYSMVAEPDISRLEAL